MGANAFGKYKCPCCGYFTLKEEAGNTFQDCPVCNWEDDGVQLHDPTYEGGANHMSLNQAKESYMKFGAKDERSTGFVRPPTNEELET